MSKTRSKVEWFSVKDELPKGSLVDGIVCLTLPLPKCAIYGQYQDKDGKTVVGFHDFDIKLREYKVTHWALFPYPDSK